MFFVMTKEEQIPRCAWNHKFDLRQSERVNLIVLARRFTVRDKPLACPRWGQVGDLPLPAEVRLSGFSTENEKPALRKQRKICSVRYSHFQSLTPAQASLYGVPKLDFTSLLLGPPAVFYSPRNSTFELSLDDTYVVIVGHPRFSTRSLERDYWTLM